MFCLFIVVLLIAPATQAADELSIAAAADLQFVLPKLIQQFEKQTGQQVRVVFGSSGNFTSQIQNGAPFDLFFSADLTYPEHLDAAGLIEPGSIYHYADGKIVLWALTSTNIDVSHGLGILLDPKIHKISIANPEHAPYGRAAVAALKHEDIYSQVQEKIVLAENVSQAAQFVDSGAAQVGIVALSLAAAPTVRDRGNYFTIPQSDYPGIEQGCAIVKSSQHKKAARQFLDFIKTPQATAFLEEFGFAVSKEKIPRD
ncbi:MAG: molybdate ABC transporter substrate-binding protein [Terriglobales bacterium]